MTDTTEPAKHLWQAESYHQHSSAQRDAAEHLLQSIRLKGNERILDVGCGDGKITAALAKCVPVGCVIGVDISPEMINFASKTFGKDHYPNLTFLCQDAQQFNCGTDLDIVFSSFALQWLPKPSLFIRCVNKSLKTSGYIAATIPLGISSELEAAINSVVALPDWSGYFKAFSSGWHFLTDEKYKQLLIEHEFVLRQFATISQKVIFPSREHFEKYIIQWLPHLNPLPQHLKQGFLEQIINKYLESSPILESGQVEFTFSRVDFIAEKSIL